MHLICYSKLTCLCLQVKDKQYHEAKEAAEAAVLPHIDGLPPPPPSQQEFMQFNGGGRRAPRGNFYGGGR